MRKPTSTTIVSLMFAIWLAVCGWGFACLLRFESTPSPIAGPCREFPAGHGIELAKMGKTLVMFSHPRCGCTRASINELANLIAKGEGPLTVYVAVLRPTNVEPGWSETPIITAARQISGVRVVPDDGGKLATTFGVETSGHTLVYDERGTLLFQGGITASRGHEGMSAGHATILEVLSGKPATQSEAPVFGCGLFASPHVRTEAP